MQYLRARYYDISDGRFITADDYLGDTEEPLTLNRYAYTANNPMKYVDPSGHFSLTKFTLNRFSNIDMRANILRTANNAFGKAIKTVTAISSLFMPQSTRKAYTTVVNNAVNKMTASVNRNINNGNYSNYNTTGKYSKYNNYSYNNNRYSKTGNTSTGVKQKTNTTIQNTYKPIIETFVNMMGIGVQLAVGSSQVKRHLDYVKKKIVNYYCGISEKIMSTVKENKRIEIDSWKKSYGFTPQQYMLISKSIKSLENSYDRRYKDNNNERRAHFVYGTLASLCQNYTSTRFYLTAGNYPIFSANMNLNNAGLSTQEIIDLYTIINWQHGIPVSNINGSENSTYYQELVLKNDIFSDRKKDFAHEIIQYSTFSYGYHTETSGIIRNAIENLSIEDGISTIKYEMSFKGDIDSTRWGYDFKANNEKLIIEQFDYTDFNSDIDAINIYERMKKNNDFSDNIITSYNSRLGSTTKPVTEFLKNMGNGNEHDGMNTVIRIMNSDSVLSQYIQSGAEGDRVNMSKAAFMYYLISEWEKENKR